MIVTQRSQLETYETCPRKAYWQYHYRGRGVERRSLSMPLLTGQLLHQPLAQVLSLYIGDGAPTPTGLRAAVDEAVRQARTRYLEIVRDRGIQLDYFDGSPDDSGKVITIDSQDPTWGWQLNEQLSLLEAVVHGWVRVRLPRLLDEYDVVDVEKEQEVDLGQDVTMLTRRDSLLNRRQTGEDFVLSVKSVSSADKTWIESFRYDMQTMSEFVAAARSRPSRICRGVLVEGLIKGPRNLVWPRDIEPAQRRHNNPLVYHYIEPANPPFPESYSAGPYRRCTDPHPWRWVKGGQCPGGKNHKLPDSYQLNMVSQTIGIEKWLDWLETHEPEVLAAQFISLPPILRSDYEIERWRKQTVLEAIWMAENARGVKLGEDIDVLFPMHTGHQNCLRPSRCPYLDLCWGAADPDDPDQFVPRTFNHPQEEELRNAGNKPSGPSDGSGEDRK